MRTPAPVVPSRLVMMSATWTMAKLLPVMSSTVVLVQTPVVSMSYWIVMDAPSLKDAPGAGAVGVSDAALAPAAKSAEARVAALVKESILSLGLRVKRRFEVGRGRGGAAREGQAERLEVLRG